MPTIHLQISGKVQGVYFRASAKEAAEQLGLTGWVKNSANGDVESVANGSEEKLAKFVEWCKMGPPGAKVVNVVVKNIEEAAFRDFAIIRGR